MELKITPVVIEEWINSESLGDQVEEGEFSV